MKKAFKLNVATQKIEEITLSGNNINEIYSAIGNNCDCFGVLQVFENNDAMYFDDEGLFKPYIGGIIMDGWIAPILGNVLIIGTDNEGGNAEAKSTIEDLQSKIKFLTYEEIFNTNW